MLRLLLCIVFLLFVFASAFAEWIPLDEDANAPWYGSAKFFSQATQDGTAHLYAADGIGQFYHSSDNGETWENSNEPENTTFITAMLADPNPDRVGWVYIGRYATSNPGGINGFWRSTDGGETFEQQNGDGCYPPAPLENVQIQSIRMTAGSSPDELEHVIVSCFINNLNQPELYQKMFYSSDPTDEAMCWDHLYSEFPWYREVVYFPFPMWYYHTMEDYAYHYYDLEDVEIFLATGDLAGPFFFDYNGVWRDRGSGWELTLGGSYGDRYWAGTRKFAYKNGDQLSWPPYHIGAWIEVEGNDMWLEPEVDKYDADNRDWICLNDLDEFPGESYSRREGVRLQTNLDILYLNLRDTFLISKSFRF